MSYRKNLAPLLVFLAAAFVAAETPLQAQIQFARLYPAKFVCGYNPGQVPLLSDPTSLSTAAYEMFKPGNYATAINITNATLNHNTFYVYISQPDGSLVFLGSLTLRPLRTFKLSCTEIAAGLGLAGSTFFEGVAQIFSLNDYFELQAVYTYSSRDAFERHRVKGLNTSTQTLHARMTEGRGVVSLTPDTNNPVDRIAGSGAGGLGLGASIDVEEVQPRFLNPTIEKDRADAEASPAVKELDQFEAGSIQGIGGDGRER